MTLRAGAAALLALALVGCRREPPPPAPAPTASAPVVMPPAPVVRRLLPVDEAPTSPSFLAFRTELADIVARKDAPALLAVVDPGIRTDFGGGGGTQAFVETWKPEDPASPLWSELGAVLALGGAFDPGGTFWAPYVFAKFPGDLDSFEWAAIVGENVPVLAEPRLDAPETTRLSHDLVRLLEDKVENGWTAIQVGGVGAGFVRSESVRSPVSWRAGFTEKEGRWLMTTFVAGD